MIYDTDGKTPDQIRTAAKHMMYLAAQEEEVQKKKHLWCASVKDDIYGIADVLDTVMEAIVKGRDISIITREEVLDAFNDVVVWMNDNALVKRGSKVYSRNPVEGCWMCEPDDGLKFETERNNKAYLKGIKRMKESV